MGTNKEKEEFSRQSVKMSGDKLKAFYLSALVGALNRGTDAIVKAIEAQTKDHGKWQYIQTQVIGEGLAAIALAASTPTDNSEEVKELTAKLKASSDELQAAVDANQPE